MAFDDILNADNAALFDPELLGMPGASVETVDYIRGDVTLASGISINIERGDISRAKDFRSSADISPQTKNGVAYISDEIIAEPVYQDEIVAADGIWTVQGLISTEGGLHEVSIEKDLARGFEKKDMP